MLADSFIKLVKLKILIKMRPFSEIFEANVIPSKASA
jgi:hypothetical protein